MMYLVVLAEDFIYQIWGFGLDQVLEKKFLCFEWALISHTELFSKIYRLIDLFTAENSHVLCNFFDNLLYPVKLLLHFE